MPMSAAELKNLDKNITRLKEQLANKRDTLVTIAPEEKVRVKQQIDDLREQIRDLERDQWQLISQMTGDLAISNEEAEPIVAELVTEVETVKQQPDQLSSEILGLLQQILAKLNAPNTPAAAKLKAAISALPPFVSLTYEAELDTENTFRTYFPTFNRYFMRVKDKLINLNVKPSTDWPQPPVGEQVKQNPANLDTIGTNPKFISTSFANLDYGIESLCKLKAIFSKLKGDARSQGGKVNITITELSEWIQEIESAESQINQVLNLLEDDDDSEL